MPGRKLAEVNSNYFTAWEGYRENVTSGDGSLDTIPIFSLSSEYRGGEHVLYVLIETSGCDVALYLKRNNKFYKVAELSSISGNRYWRIDGLIAGDYIISITNVSGSTSLYVSHS